ncbi:RNA cap guanine-N2 methyltransferase-domain-containing protein [Ochromonadaceae sp. CCMP2298]|nr:RNA cap guanine-N2 methyltransferase-domain-containing protein [Ochromonadaceae sp. CCMP2298]|mmetsp:Transcript_4281/g.9614  ORF Transcript_4281/g.9614 Transcript_4281/m.9614 type:complete len:551 (+) Transcript_4281:268-1920(+)|eukprot:CAMPEP_0173174600 /NCGR_PEP_ID=MMETSP1141-20130122/3441_1 /TAXON_ID=483371 /ORGANISM="non described non described, Strain CCMP2298" /LENGTH=550 /DNA_ID=CAMNT_0014096739 /DNA_START=240 /DNA_END=1892 /DNA_ORIENTATION=+
MVKVKRALLTDQCGSAYQIRSKVREVVWGMVEKLQQDVLAASEVQVVVMEEAPMLIADLPMQFSSKGSKKRKGGGGTKQTLGKSQRSDVGTVLPMPWYNGTLLEHNVYCAQEDGENVFVRVIGNGPQQPPGSSALVKFITGKGGLVELDRALLRPLLNDQLLDAAAAVREDIDLVSRESAPQGVHLKYWDQRYRLLSKFDHGILLDEESWYSITPEAVAKHVTASCIGRAREKADMNIQHVLDCFSGCGGNSIPFAAQGRAVTSIDLDEQKLQHLRHNAGVYKASGEITTVCADVYTYLESQLDPATLSQVQAQYQAILQASVEADAEYPPEGATSLVAEAPGSGIVADSVADAVDSVGGAGADTGTDCSPAPELHAISGASGECAQKPSTFDLIILSPPWGGPEYIDAPSFDLYTMLTCGCGMYLAMLAQAVSRNVLYLLPIQTHDWQLRDIAQILKQPIVIENVAINNAPKVKAVYMGSMAAKARPNVPAEGGDVPVGKTVDTGTVAGTAVVGAEAETVIGTSAGTGTASEAAETLDSEVKSIHVRFG